MRVAAYNGLLSSNLVTLPTPPFTCPSGDCTWDPFSTLAVSSQCVNITDNVSLNCSEGDSPDNSTDYCNFLSINDPTLQSLLNQSTDTDKFFIEAGSPRLYLDVLEPYANMTGFLGVVQWVRALAASGNAFTDRSMNSSTRFEAGRCFFYLSVIEVQAEVNNGVYSERTLQEFTDVQNRPSAPSVMHNGTEFFYLDVFAYDMDYTLIYNPPFASNQPNNSNTFSLTDNMFTQLASLIWSADFVNGMVSVGFSSGAQGVATNRQDSNENILLLYKANNISRAMQNLAQYITTEMRAVDSETLQQEQGNNSLVARQQAVVGTVWTQKQFVTVRWAWLALPAVLLWLTLFLFVATGLKTKNSGVGVWTSSPLTLLFHGRILSDLEGVQLTKLNTAEEMEKVAENIRVKITDNFEGTTEQG